MAVLRSICVQFMLIGTQQRDRRGSPFLGRHFLQMRWVLWARSMMPDQTATTKDAVAAQNVPHRIYDKLAEQDFTDINIVPGSYIVNGEDRNGSPLMMLIGRGSMTVMKGRLKAPAIPTQRATSSSNDPRGGFSPSPPPRSVLFKITPPRHRHRGGVFVSEGN